MIGPDMARFRNPGTRCLCRVRSSISESTGRKKGNSGTGHGNRYLARVLGDGGGGRTYRQALQREISADRWAAR
jgi:transposase